MGHSNRVFFSIDTIAPSIVIMLPLNQSYSSTDIQLTFKVDEPTKELAYILDNNAKVSMIGNVSLPALANGSHRLTIYATDEIGNADSKTVYFSIQTFPTMLWAAIIAIIIIVAAAGYLFVKRKKVENKQELPTDADSTSDKESKITD